MTQGEIESLVIGDESLLMHMVAKKERLVRLRMKIAANERQLTRNILRYLKRVQG